MQRESWFSHPIGFVRREIEENDTFYAIVERILVIECISCIVVSWLRYKANIIIAGSKLKFSLNVNIYFGKPLPEYTII